MSTKYRLLVTKGEEIRHISHLDYARTIERALRRAKLPMAYSEGFNPHMKMSFASALSVGVASEAEYMDIELAVDTDAAVVEASLAPQLPPGIKLRRLKPVTARHAALMAVVNLASYNIHLPLTDGATTAAAAAAVDGFNQAASVPYIKTSPKGRREIDIKALVERVELAGNAGALELSMDVKITPTGSVKPVEVVNALTEIFGLPANPEKAVVTRTGLYIAGPAGRVLPLDL